MPPLSPRLPYYTTSFIGREAELARLCDALRPDATPRAVVVTGPAGAGKTRLLVEAAHRSAAAFQDGVVYVDLAPLESPDLVAAAVARAVGVDESPSGWALDALCARLSQSELLLLLDNCGHLSAAADALTAALVQAAPRLIVGCTSRQSFRGSGAAHYVLSPLQIPDLHCVQSARAFERCKDVESIRLFCARAEAARPGFVLTPANVGHIAALCRRLDGLPLALELAAGQLRMFTPRELGERLRATAIFAGGDEPAARHESLTAALALSFRLLTPPEQLLLRRLAPFVGGAQLEAIEVVAADAQLPALRILPLLTRLVDKSLVQVEPMHTSRGEVTRYRLLETVRSFACEALERSDELEPVRGRYCSYYRGLAEDSAQGYRVASSLEWVERIESDYENVRNALGCLIDHDPARAAALVQQLVWYWVWRSQFAEGKEWTMVLLQRSQALGVRARALYARAVLAAWAIEFDVGYALIAEALAAADEAGDADLLVHLRSYAAVLAVCTGRLDEAEATVAWLEANASFQAQRWERGSWGFVAGMAQRARGKQEAALARLDEAARNARALGDLFGLANLLHELGKQHALMGAYRTAERCLQESLEVSDRIGNRLLQTLTFFRMAETLQAQGRAAEALDWFEAGLVQMEAQGDAPGLHQLRSLASMAIDAGDWALGVRLYTAANAATSPALSPDAPLFVQQREQMARALLALSGAEADGARAEGARMTVGEAVHLGLEALRAALNPPPPAGDTPALELRMMGVAEVRVDGRTLEMGDWKYARARDLLFYLVCKGARTREQIALVFWPDADPAAARNRLNVTLHFLRRALGGSEWVRYEGGRYLFHQAGSYSCDCDDFFSLLAQAEQIKGDEPARAVDLLERATQRVRGEFLADVTEGEWHEDLRRSIHRKMVDAFVQLGQLRRTLGRPREAVAAFAEAMGLDCFEEAVYRGLMEAHGDRGDLLQIMQVYRHMAELFADEFGAPPSAETIALYRSLVERLGAAAALDGG